MSAKSFFLGVASLAVLVCQSSNAAQTISTRFGQLKTDEFDMELSYKGKQVAQGNNSIRLAKKFQVGESDVLLMQDNGGNTCPALYVFVSVTAAGVKVSDRFGSCNELSTATQDGDAITVVTPGFAMVNGAYKQSGEKTKCSFAFKAGVVSKPTNKLCVGE